MSAGDPRYGATIQKIGTAKGPDLDAALQQLLDFTRSPTRPQWSSILGTSGMEKLGRCAFASSTASPTASQAVSPVTRHLALRCLNNLLFLSEPTRQLFVDSGYAPKLLDFMKSDDADDIFLSTRLMLFSSVGTDLDLNPYFDDASIPSIITKNLSRHDNSKYQSTLEPTLNLLSTLGAIIKYESQTHHFRDSVPYIVAMIDKAPTSLPLSTLSTLLISALVAIPLEEELPISVSDKLVDILDHALPATADYKKDAESSISPIMALLLRLADQPLSKTHLKTRLLASESDRATPLGQGDSLPNRLIRLSAEIAVPTLKQLATLILYKLSDEDPKQLITNVGYGYGVGLLQSLNITVAPEDGQSTIGGADVNPVTGQRLDAETVDSLPEMTQEEKEREAERLFVLFERLKQTGVVDIENPVAQAMSSGFVEEIEDDSDDAPAK